MRSRFQSHCFAWKWLRRSLSADCSRQGQLCQSFSEKYGLKRKPSKHKRVKQPKKWWRKMCPLHFSQSSHDSQTWLCCRGLRMWSVAKVRQKVTRWWQTTHNTHWPKMFLEQLSVRLELFVISPPKDKLTKKTSLQQTPIRKFEMYPMAVYTIVWINMSTERWCRHGREWSSVPNEDSKDQTEVPAWRQWERDRERRNK